LFSLVGLALPLFFLCIPLPLLLPRLLNATRRTVGVLPARRPGVGAQSRILVHEGAPPFAFPLLDTEFHGSVGEDALVLLSHRAERAPANVPVIAQPGAELGVVSTAQGQIGVALGP